MSKEPKPKTNLEGLALVLTKVKGAALGRQLSPPLGRAGVAKWKINLTPGVPVKYVDQVAKITGLTREEILPEVYGKPTAR